MDARPLDALTRHLPFQPPNRSSRQRLLSLCTLLVVLFGLFVAFPLLARSSPAYAATPLQINAGGAAVAPFAADTDFTGGATASVTNTINTSNVTNPAPVAVYQSNRYGNFTYTIPGLTASASYTVRLHFAEEYWTAAGKRVFNVSINGTQVLTNFDIFATAGGEYIAVVEQFTATASTTGTVTIQFTNVTDNAQVNGIEVLASGSTTPTPTPTGGVQINCGGSAASPFVADTDFTGGATSSVTNTINTSKVTNPAPMAVYQSNRYGNFTYTIPGLTAGASYTVRLHFAEEYWTAAGKRVFNVSINGTQVLTNFDIFATAGGEYIAVAEQFAATADTTGTIMIQFASVTDNAQVNGIEVLGGMSTTPTPNPPTPTPTPTSTGGNPPVTPSEELTAGYDSSITMTWTASPGATSYNIYRSTTSGAEGTTPYVTVQAPATSFKDSNLSSTPIYFYELTAVNSHGESARTAEDASKTPPPAITGGTTPGVASGNSLIFYCENAQLSGFDWFQTLTGWFPQVLGSSGSNSPNQMVVDMAYASEGELTFKDVVVPTSGLYTITWRYAFQGGLFPAVTNRQMGLEVNGKIITTTERFPITGSFDVYQDSSLQVQLNAGTNTVSLLAVSDHGVSRVDQMIVTPATASVPSGPTNLVATPGSKTVTLTWTGSSSGSPTSYTIYRGTASDGEATTPIATVSGTTLTFTDTGLTSGKTYYYNIAANNSVGISPDSNEVSVAPN